MFGWMKKQKGTEGKTVVAVEEKPVSMEEKAVTVMDESETGLKVKVKERKGCSVTMAVVVPADRVIEATEEAFKRVQGKAKFPGFRPGKAPMELVKKNFEGAAWEDAVDHLLKESIYDALTQEKVIGVGAPTVDKLDGEPGKPLRYELKIECAPNVVVKEYKGLSLVKSSRGYGRGCGKTSS
ncbi:MAG: trigger factor family protein [Elusimicrobia bacterium]|nr:trigger factor family protein [Elusimicrobiota bacterium]